MATLVPTWEWVTILVCVLLSGFFSGSETAYTSLSKAKFQALIDSRRRQRDPLHIWLRKPSDLLTAILIGNNLVNIGASALATDIASRIFRSQGLAVAVGVTTLVILVVGEITPKVMARRYAERMVLASAWSLAGFYYLCWPLTYIFGALTRFLIQSTGGDPQKDFSTVEADELERQVAMSAAEGGIETLPADLIGKVFRFSDKSVKDIMVPRTGMVALEAGDDARKIMEVANLTGHSRLPVFSGAPDEVIGVFHVKDLFREPVERWGEFKLAEHLNPPTFIPESAHLGDVLGEFQERRHHLAIVVDEFGGTEGIVTLEDILEELVGEIQDEFDQDEVNMRRLPSGALEVSGQTPVEDLRSAFAGWAEKVPAKTVGGLVMEVSGKVPVPGEAVFLEGLRFTVLRSDDRRILKIRVEDQREAGVEG